jgi:predicted nuclease with TOPRIM domain
MADEKIEEEVPNIAEQAELGEVNEAAKMISDEMKKVEDQIAADDEKLKEQREALAERQAELEKNAELADKQAELAKRQAKIAKRQEVLEAQEAELADAERKAFVRAKQIEVDAREDALKETDKMIITHLDGEKAKPGEAFIDKDGIQHRGNCNSHPSKRGSYHCDCGRNGTSISKKR